MSRLTFKESDGTFGVVGMNEENEDLKTYACVCKLLEYEETGFNPSFLSTVPDILTDIKERFEHQKLYHCYKFHFKKHRKRPLKDSHPLTVKRKILHIHCNRLFNECQERNEKYYDRFNAESH